MYDSRNDCNAIIETASNTLIAGCKITKIPNSVTSIGNQAFAYYTGLTSINIPNSVTSIGDEAFYCCTGLTSIDISNSVKSIGNYAFYSCTALTSIDIPNSVTSIGEGAFYYCTGLTSIDISNSVKSIGNYAFAYCKNLKDVYSYSKEPPTLGSKVFSYGVKNNWFEAAGSALIVCPEWTESEEPARVQIEASTSVPNHYRLVSPFYAMEPEYADEGYHIEFYYDAATGKFTMDEGMYYIGEQYKGDDVFLYYYPSRYPQYNYLENEGNIFVITSLWGHGNSLWTPMPITFTWDEGFPRDATAPKLLPKTNTAMHQGGNDISNKKKFISPKVLEKSVIQSMHPTNKAQKIRKESKETLDDYCILHVPAGCKDAYSSAWLWPKELIVEDLSKSSDLIYDYDEETKSATIKVNSEEPYSGEIVIPETVVLNDVTYTVIAISNSAFSNCTGLTSITIPKSVTSIGNEAFYQCDNLTDIYMLNNIPPSIGTNAFPDQTKISGSSTPDLKAADVCTIHIPAGSRGAYETAGYDIYRLVEENLTGISPVEKNSVEASVTYYNLQGQRITQPQCGQMVIARYGNGTTRKMIVK